MAIAAAKSPHVPGGTEDNETGGTMEHIIISEILAAKPHHIRTVTPYACVTDAVRLMNRYNIGALLVMDEGVLLGIITERDVLFRVVGQHLEPEATLVSDIMTRGLVTVTPHTTLQEAMHRVTEQRVRHLPVLDDDQLVGVVSSGDLTRAITQSLEREVDALSSKIPVAPNHMLDV
ncbi:MAG: CBS domain-containing protein [Polyangiaceae bacterium]